MTCQLLDERQTVAPANELPLTVKEPKFRSAFGYGSVSASNGREADLVMTSIGRIHDSTCLKGPRGYQELRRGV